MKYMNNHFGKSRIFEKPRCKIPMNLQLFAESGDNGSVAEDGEGSSSPDSALEDTPTVEELMTQLAEERAKTARLQNEKDTASSEAANFKKQLRAKMTANEQEEAEKKARDEAIEKELKELRNESRINKYSKRFMGVGMDESTATELASLTGEIAEPDKFFSVLDKFVKTTIKKAGEDSVEALIKSNPSIKAGNGSSDQDDEAVEIARESAKRKKNNGFNEEALKQWM